MLIQALVALVVAFAVSAVLVRNGRHWTVGLDDDKPQRFHIGDVPRLGGVALAAGMAIAGVRAALSPTLGDVGLAALNGAELAMWWLAVLPGLAAAWYEDCTQRLEPRWRLLLTFVTGLLAVVLLDLSIARTGFAFLDVFWQSSALFGVCLAVVAIAGLPHAFNIIDGYNGLAGVIAAAAALALAYVAIKVGDWRLAGWLIGLVGATLGFLFWNYPRGLLFAGDGGAYLWGISLAIASIQLVQGNSRVSPWFPMLVFVYPVSETLFSIYRKWVRGESPSVADALHFHQLIYRRIVRQVFEGDQVRRLLIRNNKTSPYLWAFAAFTLVPAVLFWDNSWILMLFCLFFMTAYIVMYRSIIRFKVPTWLRF
ncbi:MraY family glycosyltransferase [Tepidimonas charontis]|uniref:Putative undecaprenyl-phosphate N-acetylglucosaminyl 1-phosphate transferase n=1 Tax=Tepidimonas charontis TaxID=2267262 RepID=A0A554XCB0_9BURK|nr:glycosyltransferase [Tepidimonas charontis]TSE33463.1 putative undecaprenyl-phosphate N-acetylglucosaminyl 1-phosphate transferase [Tepidimonas charontis]